LTAREHHNHGEQNSTSTRITAEEASLLQSYPADFNWDAPVPDAKKPGRFKRPTQGKKFLQIGNAVPPLLAFAILDELVGAAVIDQEEAA